MQRRPRMRRTAGCVAVCVAGAVVVSAAGATSGDTPTPRVGNPVLTTSASPNTGIGGQLTDTAVLTGLEDPATGDVTFTLYAPSDPTCAGPAIHTSTVPIVPQGSGVAIATSTAYSPTENGVFHWIADYNSGAANNPDRTGTCGDPNEEVLVGDAIQPPPQTTPPPAAVLPDFALFIGSPTTLRVSKLGSFTYRFYGPPGRDGKASATSSKSIKIGTTKKKVKLASKSFTVPDSAIVKVKFKLSKRNLKALKARTSLKFVVNVTVGSKKFSAKLKLKPPKKS